MFQQQFSSMWTLWSYYSNSSMGRGPQNQYDYHKNLVKVLSFSSFEELAYLLQNSKYSSYQNFFTNFIDKKILKFEVEKNEFKQIDAISLFRDNIEPTWQYGDNGNGGQFNTSINRDGNLDTKYIYQSLMIALAGDVFPNPKDILGIRFVQKFNKNENRYLVKVQIWTSYNVDATQKIKQFTIAFSDFAKEVQWPLERFQFKNNK